MAKKVVNQIKLQIIAGKATPSPPVGPALGQAGVNIPMFVKEFNARTAAQAAENVIVPVVITVYSDKSLNLMGSLIGAGLLYADGDFADKYVTASDAKVNHMSYGFTGKTRLGPVNLAATFHTGYNLPKN